MATKTTEKKSRRDHFDITTAQLLDPNYDKTAFLAWNGGVEDCNRVARIMLPLLVAPNMNSAKPKGQANNE